MNWLVVELVHTQISFRAFSKSTIVNIWMQNKLSDE